MSPRPRFGPRREDPFAWLSLVLTEGPFLSRPALKAQYAQGLPRPDSSVDEVGHAFRDGFTAWERAWTAWVQTKHSDGARDRYLGQRDQWVQSMVRSVLEWDGYFQPGGAGIRAASLDGQVTVVPLGMLATAEVPEALLLVVEPTDDLAAPGIDGWTASAIDRGAALLRSANDHATTKVPVAVVTDGRWWSLVWTSDQGSVGSGTFDGALFREEPDLRDAFWSLARLTSLAGGAPERRLPALLAASVASAEEITDALGRQVRAAVELLVQSFSESHVRALESGGVSPLPADGHQAYEAAVTVMMRVIFLLFAEANELLPEGDLFHEAYAISGVGDRLDERRRQAVGVEGEELLEGSFDTWHRMLATSRALYEGATFEDLRMPAYGGSLFDPERFDWMAATDATTGRLQLLVDDRVMWHVLRAVEHVIVSGEDRTVSFRELDVEQIGYVYEGLLGYSARFTSSNETMVGLDGPDDGSEPEIPLKELHGLADDAGEDGKEFAKLLLEWVKKNQPGAKARTVLQIAKAYDASGNAETQTDAQRLLRPVVREQWLIDELVGYIGLIRRDLRGLPYVVPAGGLVVVETRSRATSGTHYTPRFLAEEVALHALEPLVYSPGPLQTADTSEWVPISSSQILELKVADIAVGSGAFLVAAARYLGRKLLEAWDREGITGEDGTGDSRKRREIEARREIIAHCLYGADINSMAVEMCKLSLWLVSLDQLKPFSFVDDKIFCGNSLLGLTEIRQLRGLHTNPSQRRLMNPGFSVDVDGMIERSTELRHRLASTVSESDAMRTIRGKRALLEQLNANSAELRSIADGVVATALSLGGKSGKLLDQSYEVLSVALMTAFPEKASGAAGQLFDLIKSGLTPSVVTDWPQWKPLHWIIEVPDVMVEKGGFDAIIGNPPFLGVKNIRDAVGQNMRDFLANSLVSGQSGRSDYWIFFLRRAADLCISSLGIVAPDSAMEGDAWKFGLAALKSGGWIVDDVGAPIRWSSAAVNTVTVQLSYRNGAVKEGSPTHDTQVDPVEPQALQPRWVGYQGTILLGKGLLLTRQEAEALVADSPQAEQVVRPYLSAEDLTSRPDGSNSRWAIDYRTRSLSDAMRFSGVWSHVQQVTRPERELQFVKYPGLINKWWQPLNACTRLYAAAADLNFVIAFPKHSKYGLPLLIANRYTYSNGIVVVPDDDTAAYAFLSSSVHQLWSDREGGSSINRDIRYNPSRTLATLPVPGDITALRQLGSTLSELVTSGMANWGSHTALYNSASLEPDNDPLTRELLDVHWRIDRDTLASYGWQDLASVLPRPDKFSSRGEMIPPGMLTEIHARLLSENLRLAELQASGRPNGGRDPQRGR